MVPEGEDFRLTATVADSWQLRWWILSQGAGLTVLEPENLRMDIYKNLKETLNNYKKYSLFKSVTTGKAGGLTDCEPLKAVYSTDSLTTFRWSTI
jgi:hypothetical protein